MEISEIVKTARNVPWEEVRQVCCESCSGIADYLADLCSDDPQVRHRAYWRFDNHVVVQSGLFSGAFYVIPFIIELLRENIRSNRHNRELYDLLIELGIGCGTGDVWFSIATEPFIYYLPDRSGTRWSLTEACHNAVFAGWNVYYEDLMNPASPNRVYALDLISALYRNNLVVRNTVMQQLVDREPHSEVGRLAAEYLAEELYP